MLDQCVNSGEANDKIQSQLSIPQFMEFDSHPLNPIVSILRQHLQCFVNDTLEPVRKWVLLFAGLS